MQTKMINKVKQKMAAGEKVFGGTVTSPDTNIYCAMASSGYDYLWIEMQHSPLTYSDVAKMLWAARDLPAAPFIRIPDATEGDIQKAVDIGAVGIIVPTVDTIEKAETAIKWAKYPPVGRRNQGPGQYSALYGNEYRQIANDNVVIVAMIETPIGVENVEKIVAVPGIDAIFIASVDMGNFSGFKPGQPEYEALVQRVHEVATKNKMILGGPQAWKDRPGFTFFQAPTDVQLIQLGVKANLQ